jgi:hypothetical protein
MDKAFLLRKRLRSVVWRHFQNYSYILTYTYSGSSLLL